MSKLFFDGKDYKCPICGENLNPFYSEFTEEKQEIGASCRKCDKIFDIKFKVVFDSMHEYLED